MSLSDTFQALPVTKRPVSGHFVYYHVDGTGRDSYISTINGGFYSKDLITRTLSKEKQDQSKFKVSLTQPSRNQIIDQPKVSNYISDGSGRDSYICRNNGGFTFPYSWRNQQEFKFKQSLRDWSKERARRSYHSPFDQAKQTYTFIGPSFDDSIYQVQKRQSSLIQKLAQSKTYSLPYRQMRTKLNGKINGYQSYYVSNDPSKNKKQQRLLKL